MTSGFDTDDCEKSSNAQMPVDLRLAHTYVPALSCLTRSSLLVLLISRPWSAASVPVHTLLCICLLADRVIRHESIFDSNSLMCTIAAASFVNTLRTGPMDGALTIVNEHQRLASNVAYAGISLLLLLGYDVGSMGIESAFKTGLGVANLPSRPLTVVLHCVLLALAVQTKLSPDAMGTHSIMFRSYAFLCLSVGWVYAVGIPEMVALLGSTTRRWAASSGPMPLRAVSLPASVCARQAPCPKPCAEGRARRGLPPLQRRANKDKRWANRNHASQANHRAEGAPVHREEIHRDIDVHGPVLPPMPTEVCLRPLLRRMDRLRSRSDNVHDRRLQGVPSGDEGRRQGPCGCNEISPAPQARCTGECLNLCSKNRPRLTRCAQDLQECVHPEYSSNGAPLRCANEPLTPLYTTYDSSKIHPTADGVGRVSITPSRAFLLRPSEHEAPVANAKPQKRITTQQPTEKADDEDDTVRLFMQAKRIAESNI